jgi:hypothetical protein
LIHPQ